MLNLKLLIAQIAVILIVARFVGWLFGKLHQPRVIFFRQRAWGT
jgi:Kef-type K+ transport system membrane component KefB